MIWAGVVVAVFVLFLVAVAVICAWLLIQDREDLATERQISKELKEDALDVREKTEKLVRHRDIGDTASRLRNGTF